MFAKSVIYTILHFVNTTGALVVIAVLGVSSHPVTPHFAQKSHISMALYP